MLESRSSTSPAGASPFTVNSTRWSTKVISFAGYGCRKRV
jgi:hypothetical protein